MFKVIWQKTPVLAPSSTASATLPSEVERVEPLLAGLDIVGDISPVFLDVVPPEEALAPPPLSSALDLLAASDDCYQAFFPNQEQAEELRRRLEQTGAIEFAEIQGEPSPPVALSFLIDGSPAPTPPSTPSQSFEAKQQYLGPASIGGVGAVAAWHVEGGRGKGIRIVDVEQGWNFQHEDLWSSAGGLIGGVVSNQPGYLDHGTAVLGVLAADANSYGVRGVAYEAVSKTISVLTSNAPIKWNIPAALRRLRTLLRPGDVVLIEQQLPGPMAGAFVPVELSTLERNEILELTRLGIYVVEAAGNGGKKGGENLDALVYNGRFSRSAFDSGAIFVGAGASTGTPPARSRLPFSNYGSRLDVQGWGERVATCGGASGHYQDLTPGASSERSYTSLFNGTSSAAAIVAGVVACLSGAIRHRTGSALAPSAMRDLLVRTGSPQTNHPQRPATEHIGPLPDLQAALTSLGLP